jgi:hypothetical protein
MITTNACCTILVSEQSAPQRLRELAERFCADAVDPWAFRCARCGLEWSDPPYLDYRDVTCSNCYSDRVVITIVRLGFEDWGPQNGGAAEQQERLKRAEREFAPAMRALQRINGDDKRGLS